MVSEFNFIQASQVPSNVCMFGDLAWLTLFFFKDNQTTLVIKTTHERGITQFSSSNLRLQNQLYGKGHQKTSKTVENNSAGLRIGRQGWLLGSFGSGIVRVAFV